MFVQTQIRASGIMFTSAQGELFNHCDTDGPMWTGTNDRDFRLPVTFDTAFDAPPIVTLGLSGLDIAHEQNARLSLRAEDVTAQGFTIVLHTWSDTRIARASVSWMAIGALALSEIDAPQPIVPPRVRARADASGRDPALEGLIAREARLVADKGKA